MGVAGRKRAHFCRTKRLKSTFLDDMGGCIQAEGVDRYQRLNMRAAHELIFLMNLRGRQDYVRMSGFARRT
jgi:hypothetical protein